MTRCSSPTRSRCVVLALALFAGSRACADEFYHDFRSGTLPRGLALFQAKKEGVVKIEPEGLRITVPKDWEHPFGGVGVSTTFGLKGDFEITTTFEILEAETPPAGFGVGVTLRVVKAEPSNELANLSRVVRAKDRQVVLWSRSVEIPGAKPKYPEGAVPCTDKVGRLRLKRVGPMLHYLWAPGTEGGEFKEIKNLEFGDNDIKRVVLVGFNGRQPANADVRFFDLRIDSGADNPAPQPAAAPVVGPPADRPRSYWWLITAVSAAALVGIALAIGVVVRRRRPSTSAEAAPIREALELRCPHCEKRLKVPSSAAGKKVKCPGCAAAFVASDRSGEA